MLQRLKSFLAGDTSAQEVGLSPEDELAAAAVAVFVEAALLDGGFGDDERQIILQLMTERFQIPETEAASLIDTAASDVEHANKLYSATRTIRDGFGIEERIDVMEMLWQVAYADGVSHDYEANLVRRVAGLLYVQDQDNGRARKRALENLGLDDSE
jgi:uncharacterized tellurite resistance protein B-like protein